MDRCEQAPAVALLAAALLIGCSTQTGTVTGQTGATQVLLTDAPFPYDQISRVDVYIERISAGVTVDTGGPGPGTIVSPRTRFNLLALSNGVVADLGSGTLLTGSYVQFAIRINADSSSITLKNNTVLTSGHGINWLGPSVFTIVAFTDPPLQVTEQGAVVVVDFNLGRSFRPVNPADASAGFEFIGYVAVLNTARTGSLRGTVTGAGAGGGGPIPDASVSLLKQNPVYPADTATWGVFGTARTDAAGMFQMAYVRPDTGYVLLVEAPSSSAFGAAARSVAVARGAETQLGTIVLPLK
jgi:hypothetical protein